MIPQSQLYAADDPGPIIGDDLVAQTILSGLSNPTSLDFTPDGNNMYVTQKDGKVFTVNQGVLQSTPFIDISGIVNGVRDRGLLDIAIHPDFENTPYVYLLFTYDPPEVNNFTGLAGPDGRGNRAGRLIRVTADAANDYKTAVAGSEFVLLGTNSTWDNFNGFANSTNDFDEPPAGILPDGTNLRDFIASDSESHTIGAIEFGTDGNLFVSIGDGTSYNRMDPRTLRVQDIDNLSGKVLRIDPITGEGLSDNPFFNGDVDANRSKVYQLGLRNPFRMTVDPVSGQLYIGDVGWTQWEEINSGPAGANFGWPYYEGGSGVNSRTNQYRDLAEAQAFYASGQVATPAIYALNHSQTGINAIILGDVYTGDTYRAEYQGDLFFNDLGQGIVSHVDLDNNGAVNSVDTFTTGAQIVVHMQQGPDGNMYYIDLNDGQVGRWVFV
ncbi:MAG: PQQ-dependent sugar dehydrogenase [Planctomycetota bacterium]